MDYNSDHNNASWARSSTSHGLGTFDTDDDDIGIGAMPFDELSLHPGSELNYIAEPEHDPYQTFTSSYMSTPLSVPGYDIADQTYMVADPFMTNQQSFTNQHGGQRLGDLTEGASIDWQNAMAEDMSQDMHPGYVNIPVTVFDPGEPSRTHLYEHGSIPREPAAEALHLVPRTQSMHRTESAASSTHAASSQSEATIETIGYIQATDASRKPFFACAHAGCGGATFKNLTAFSNHHAEVHLPYKIFFRHHKGHRANRSETTSH